MGRKPRQHHSGAFYHFIARGNNRQPIFLSAPDRRVFEGYLGDGAERFGNRCHAYCWMSNHVHMAVEIADVPLSRIAHNLLFRYARWFHRKYGRTGHLFERRYRAFLIETDAELQSVVRYIHLNPVRAQIVNDPQAYPWSSYSAYLEPGSGSPSWLVRSFTLSLFSEDLSEARDGLREFTEAEETDGKIGERPPAPESRPGTSQGDSLATNGPGDRKRHPAPSGVTLDQILVAVSAACSLDPSELRANTQTRAIVRARSVASFLVHQSPDLTLEDLSVATGRDASTHSRGAANIAGRLAHDPELRALLEKIEDRIARG